MPTPQLQISYSLSNIENAVHQFWEYAHQYSILAFSGEMGAGKTTFIHHLCDYLGVEDVVSSPTFALINEYHFSENGKDRTLFHMDWYRLKSAEEAVNAGIEDCLNNGESYCFIEWPEHAPKLLPLPHLWISIENVSRSERKMSIFLKAE